MADGIATVPIALITNSLPPYRKHVHLRIAREMPDVWAFTVRTHAEDERWDALSNAEARELNFVSLDDGLSVWEQGRPRSWLREWRIGGRLIEWIRRRRVRAVVMVGYNDPARLRLLLWCRWHRIPVLIWGDSNINDDNANLLGRPWKAAFKRALVSLLLRFSAGALAVGTAGQAYFQKYGVPAERIFRFPLEPDYAAIGSLPQDQVDQTRANFGFANERRRLLFCGRLAVEKRPDVLLEAFRAVASRRPSWDLVMLGDGEMRSKLEERVPPELRTRVIWTGHVADQTTVRAVQRCCDVLVLPSDREPWALVVNEALAAGMAVVSTSTAGAAIDLVHDGVNGRVFPPGNCRLLEECLLDVTDEQRLASMKAQSRIVLADWIQSADPIRGLQSAFSALGVTR